MAPKKPPPSKSFPPIEVHPLMPGDVELTDIPLSPFISVADARSKIAEYLETVLDVYAVNNHGREFSVRTKHELQLYIDSLLLQADGECRQNLTGSRQILHRLRDALQEDITHAVATGIINPPRNLRFVQLMGARTSAEQVLNPYGLADSSHPQWQRSTDANGKPSAIIDITEMDPGLKGNLRAAAVLESTGRQQFSYSEFSRNGRSYFSLEGADAFRWLDQALAPIPGYRRLSVPLPTVRYTPEQVRQYVAGHVDVADDMPPGQLRWLNDNAANVIGRLPPWEQALLIHAQRPIRFGSGEMLLSMGESNRVMGFFTPTGPGANTISSLTTFRRSKDAPVDPRYPNRIADGGALYPDEIERVLRHEGGHSYDWNSDIRMEWVGKFSNDLDWAQAVGADRVANPQTAIALHLAKPEYNPAEYPREAVAEMTAIFDGTYAYTDGNFKLTDAFMQTQYPRMWPVYRDKFIPALMQQARALNPALDLGEARYLLHGPEVGALVRTRPPAPRMEIADSVVLEGELSRLDRLAEALGARDQLPMLQQSSDYGLLGLDVSRLTIARSANERALLFELRDLIRAHPNAVPIFQRHVATGLQNGTDLSSEWLGRNGIALDAPTVSPEARAAGLIETSQRQDLLGEDTHGLRAAVFADAEAVAEAGSRARSGNAVVSLALLVGVPLLASLNVAQAASPTDIIGSLQHAVDDHVLSRTEADSLARDMMMLQAIGVRPDPIAHDTVAHLRKGMNDILATHPGISKEFSEGFNRLITTLSGEQHAENIAPQHFAATPPKPTNQLG